MCTVKEIREAIREDCHSQHGMESMEIDRVLQTADCHNSFYRIVVFFIP